MAKDKRPKDDLQTTAKSRMAHAPTEDASSPLNERDLGRRDTGRRDMGRQDMDRPDMGRQDLDASGPMDQMPDEPAAPPAEPARARQSMSRTDKQRNQPKR